MSYLIMFLLRGNQASVLLFDTTCMLHFMCCWLLFIWLQGNRSPQRTADTRSTQEPMHPALHKISAEAHVLALRISGSRNNYCHADWLYGQFSKVRSGNTGPGPGSFEQFKGRVAQRKPRFRDSSPSLRNCPRFELLCNFGVMHKV